MNYFHRSCDTRTTVTRRWKHTGLRMLLLTVLVALGEVAPLPHASAQGKGTVLVFLQTSERPRSLQKSLQEKLPGSTVTVFGRFRDFEKSINMGVGDVVISLPNVLEAKGFTVSMKGVIDGSDKVPYSILSSSGVGSGAELNGKTVGAVDILGRKNMGKFLAKILGTSAPPKSKLVTKYEDLLPLLQLNLAEAVVLPKPEAKRLIDKSQMKLTLTNTGKDAGLPAVSCLSPKGQSICAAVKNLPKSLKKKMGVDQWK